MDFNRQLVQWRPFPRENSYESVRDVLCRRWRGAFHFLGAGLAPSMEEEQRMRSDAVKKGVERAPHRSLLRALGCTDYRN